MQMSPIIRKFDGSSYPLAVTILIAVCFLVSCSDRAPAPVVLKGMIGPNTSAADMRGNVITVQSGDTLYSIARIIGVSVQEIIVMNGLSAPYHLHVGQLIELPEAKFHTVNVGETLYGISRHYGVDIFQLAQVNDLTHPYTIVTGQELQLLTVNQEWAALGKEENIELIPTSHGEFIWPVKGQILSLFGPKSDGIHNDGIDISVLPGTSVQASKPGVVVYAGNGLRGLGHLLLIRHEGGWITAYAHNEEILVSRGAKVEQGQPIARGGSISTDTAPKLHFEIRKGTQALNPLYYLPALQT